MRLPRKSLSVGKNNMRIRDLYESDFKDDLNNEIMNVLMMVMKTGTPTTNIENIVAELEKNDIVANENDIRDFIDNNENFDINQDNQIVFSVGDSSVDGDERPDLETEEEYNPAKDKAKEATKKRMK